MLRIFKKKRLTLQESIHQFIANDSKRLMEFACKTADYEARDLSKVQVFFGAHPYVVVLYLVIFTALIAFFLIPSTSSPAAKFSNGNAHHLSPQPMSSWFYSQLSNIDLQLLIIAIIAVVFLDKYFLNLYVKDYNACVNERKFVLDNTAISSDKNYYVKALGEVNKNFNSTTISHIIERFSNNELERMTPSELHQSLLAAAIADNTSSLEHEHTL